MNRIVVVGISALISSTVVSEAPISNSETIITEQYSNPRNGSDEKSDQSSARIAGGSYAFLESRFYS